MSRGHGNDLAIETWTNVRFDPKGISKEMTQGEWPNVFVVGAPKCGTTSFHAYLSQHPEVFTSQQKELHFFSRKSLFSNANGPGDRNALQAVAMNESEYLNHYAGAHQRVRGRCLA